MKSPILRAGAIAVLGALAGAAALLAVFNLHPQLVFELDRDLPGRALTGVYPPEIVGDDSYAWTSDRALLNVQGIDRRMAWTCSATFRGGRGPGQPQPDVSFVLDDREVATRTATNEYESLTTTVPPRDQRGLRIALTSSQTFVPGPSDPRQLGVQLDRLACSPEAGRAVRPPADAVVTAAFTAAAFGAACVVIGLGMAWSAAAVMVIAFVQAVPMSMGLAPYTPYVDRAFFAGAWICVCAAGGTFLLARFRALSIPARLAVALSAGALFVKLLALLHPSKAIIDGLFHAHRLDYVLGGRYFFTQVMPGGVQFPYAIALYVFAAPWAAFARDHVALLRIVVSSCEAVAGLLMFWAVATRWKDSAAAAMAVLLFHLLPVAFWVVGNANLTNAFGQQAALAALALAIGWRLDTRDWWQVAAVAAVAAIGLLSHVGTAALLAATLGAIAVATWWSGGKATLPAARSMIVALALAIVASAALYYARPEFFDAYKSVRAAQAEEGATEKSDVSAEDAMSTRLSEGAIPVMSLGARVESALTLAGDALGWSILALAVLGAWRMVADGVRDRLSAAVIAWLAVTAAFLAFGVIAPGGVGHQRQAMEFIARAVYAGAPAVLMLAGRGAVWGWRVAAPLRFVSVCLTAISLFVAARMWYGWVR